MTYEITQEQLNQIAQGILMHTQSLPLSRQDHARIESAVLNSFNAVKLKEAPKQNVKDIT